jgi:hypothetical protein
VILTAVQGLRHPPFGALKQIGSTLRPANRPADADAHVGVEHPLMGEGKNAAELDAAGERRHDTVIAMALVRILRGG